MTHLNPKYVECQRDLTSMVYNFFEKKIPQVVVLIIKLSKIKNWLKNYTNNY